MRRILAALQAELRHRQAEHARTPGGKDALRELQASFKMDPHLTRSLYMGDRWIARPVFTGARQAGDYYTVEAKARGIDARGNQVHIDPEWIPSDPGMVQVTPGADDAVRITVTRPGVSTLKLVAHGLTRDLTIRATHDGAAMQVEIIQ